LGAGATKDKTYNYFHEMVGVSSQTMPYFYTDFSEIMTHDVVGLECRQGEGNLRVVTNRGHYVLVENPSGARSWKHRRDLTFLSRGSPENYKQTQHFDEWRRAVIHNESQSLEIAKQNLLVVYVRKGDIVELVRNMGEYCVIKAAVPRLLIQYPDGTFSWETESDIGRNMCKYRVVNVTEYRVLLQDPHGNLLWKYESDVVKLSRASPKHYEETENFESWRNAVKHSESDQSFSETRRIYVENLVVHAKEAFCNKLQSLSAFCGRRRICYDPYATPESILRLDPLILQSRDASQEDFETQQLESSRKAVIHNQSAFGNLFVHAKAAWYKRAGGIVALLCLCAFCCRRMRK